MSFERSHSMEIFEERVDYRGELKDALQYAAQSLGLGNYTGHDVIRAGYEDLNLRFRTDQQDVFAKLLAKWRTSTSVNRYLQTMQFVEQAGLAVPQLYYKDGTPLTSYSDQNGTIRMVLMEYIPQQSLHESGRKLTILDAAFIGREASKLGALDYAPPPEFDSWAIINARAKYAEATAGGQSIPAKDSVDSVMSELEAQQAKLAALPHCFVHGDLRVTNILDNADKGLLLTDFSVSNIYPRIIELAVLGTDTIFDHKNPELFRELWEACLGAYQERTPLTPEEHSMLPLLLKAAACMDILGGTAGSGSITASESTYWQTHGIESLEFFINYFS